MGFRIANGHMAQVMNLHERIERLERQVLAAKAEALVAGLRAEASEKVRLGANLTRPEAAAFIGVSTKKLQRMEANGSFPRCRGLGTVVRYRASDVLRLASAK